MTDTAQRGVHAAPSGTPPLTQPVVDFDGAAELGDLVDQAVVLVRRWLREASVVPVDSSARQLAGVLKDPRGLAFTVGFVDGVVRPEDVNVAARNLRGLGSQVPAFLPWYMRSAVKIGAAFAPVVPKLVVPAARSVLRRMVGHLIIDATDQKLGAAIAKIRKQDVRLNLNLLGEAVLGEREAARRLAGTRRLLERDDVDYVSIKVSSTVAPHSQWAFDEAVDHIVAQLTPLYRRAALSSPTKFINLDMEEYRDLDLTIAVFTRILDQPGLTDLRAGIVLQAYLPDALSAMMRLQEWAAARTSQGGASIKVRLVKGANLPMERVEASIHGWPLATWGSKQATDTNYKRVLEYALDPQRIDAVQVGVAGHNLFDIAFAWLLAQKRGVERGIDFEMLLGMAQGQAEVVKREVGGLLLYTPVVHPLEFDVALAYLIRRLEEGASQENFMSAVFELDSNAVLFERETQRFLESIAELDRVVPAPNRRQDRTDDLGQTASAEIFENAPDTDPSLPGNQAWGRAIMERVACSTLGFDTARRAEVRSPDVLNAIIRTASTAGGPTGTWGSLTGRERGDVLRRVAASLERHRAELIEVMASETGKTIDQADPEVSEAIDFANYYAARAEELDATDGAVFTPSHLTVVTPPWNFPVAIPAGSALAALAAGSAVVMKPAGQARRSGAVMVQCLWEAGVPADALHLVVVEESELGEQLVSHPSVDRVILTGGYETAELFRSFRADLPLLAETSGKNVIIVTPSADFDLAAKDVVSSAFGHAGQKCSAASLVILVGSVSTSDRFRAQLVDAVRSLRVGYPADPRVQMGPIIEPADGKLLDALTVLAPGETWLVEPRQLDESGRLWSPGVRAGVARGSEFHLTEYFGPVLGIMTAATLDEALAVQRDIEYGLTSGLHSLEPSEIATWLDSVEAGNLYINRGITGAIVQRQPFGGWKKSSVGAGAKAGGPNYLLGLGSWSRSISTAPYTAISAPAAQLLEAARESGLSTDELYFLTRSLNSDAQAWSNEFGVARDVSQLTAERNVFRYLPVPVDLRATATGDVASLVRAVAAGLVAGSALTVSAAFGLPRPTRAVLEQLGVRVKIEADAEWLARASSRSAGRIRLIGDGSRGDERAFAEASGGRVDITVYAQPVTESGRLELLPFMREQAVSITAHRFGTPNHLTDSLV